MDIVHVMLIMVWWLWTLKSISLHVPSTALFVNERGRYLWLPCRWPRRAGTGFDFHPSGNINVKNATNDVDIFFRMNTWTSARVWWLLQPRVSYQLDCEGWFLHCKVSFKLFHIFIQHSLPFCELLIVGFPSKWTIRWCSLVPLPSQLLLVTVFFAFVLSFPISYLLAKSEAMSLVLGRAHSIPGVIKIRGMSAITIDKAYKSIHMF